MSKIGKKPLSLLEGVQIKKIAENKFQIIGPKGSFDFELPESFQLEVENKVVKIFPKQELNKKNKPLWGTLTSVLKNKIIGVSQGFEKVLILEGLGYSAEIKEKKLFLKLGYSHPVIVDIPEGISIEIKQEKGRSLIYIRGIDKEKVGQFAAALKRIKPADRYRAKGFRYFDEVIKLKPVKKAGK
jgi:large subunit ribosomal protein L6